MADKAFNECNKDHILLSTTTISTSNINSNHSGYKINDDNNTKNDKLNFTFAESKKDDFDTTSQFVVPHNTIHGQKYGFLNNYAKNDNFACQDNFPKSDNFWNGQYDWNQKYNYQPGYSESFYQNYQGNACYNTQPKSYMTSNTFGQYYGHNNYFMDQTNANYSYHTNKDYVNKNLNNSPYQNQNYGSFGFTQNQTYGNFNQISSGWENTKDQIPNNFINTDLIMGASYDTDTSKKLNGPSGSNFLLDQNQDVDLKVMEKNGFPIISPSSHSSTAQSYLSNSLESDENESDNSEDEENDLDEPDVHKNNLSAPWIQPGSSYSQIFQV